MKLAEALLLRAEYQDKLDALRQRVLSNLKVQEGETPHEDPQELLNEAARENRALCDLVQRINRANASIPLASGGTISDALAERDRLRKERALLADVAEAAVQRDYRLTHAEVRMQVMLDVKSIQKRVDDLARQYRELDTEIQGLNWTTELPE